MMRMAFGTGQNRYATRISRAFVTGTPALMLGISRAHLSNTFPLGTWAVSRVSWPRCGRLASQSWVPNTWLAWLEKHSIPEKR